MPREEEHGAESWYRPTPKRHCELRMNQSATSGASVFFAVVWGCVNDLWSLWQEVPPHLS